MGLMGQLRQLGRLRQLRRSGSRMSQMSHMSQKSHQWPPSLPPQKSHQGWQSPLRHLCPCRRVVMWYNICQQVNKEAKP